MGAVEEIKTYKIKDVEIFSAGTWNNDAYTVNDLHNMVEAFSALHVGFRPYLKLGHDSKQKIVKSSGLPSIGWIEKMYVKGEKLFADFDYVPEKIYKLIKSKAYRKVSCEVYWDLEVDGSKYPRVVGAVALLGAENPGVMNLNDILGMYSFDHLKNIGGVFQAIEKQDSFKTYTTKFDQYTEDEMSDDKQKELQDQLDLQKKNYEQAEEAKAALQKELETERAELIKLRDEKARAVEAARAAKVSEFVTGLESKKLCTPAMKDLLTELLSDKKEYTVKEKAMTKEEIISDLLTLAQESAKVNFDENSKAEFGKKGDKVKDMEEKIEQYSKDNKCDYATAYKAVMKSAKPEEEEK